VHADNLLAYKPSAQNDTCVVLLCYQQQIGSEWQLSGRGIFPGVAYWMAMRNMQTNGVRCLQLAMGALWLIVAGCSSSSSTATAPDILKVNLDTSKGPVVIELHRDWAPLGADHFYALVKSGFYDGARFFRVVPGFVVQFGLAADPAVTAKWKNMNLADDPVKQSNTTGMVTYATAGPNTRTTQVFINLADNQRLDSQGFAPFGRVISGMDIVQSFYSGYGEKPEQQLIEAQGNAYLQSQFPQLDYIKKATIQ
jgi:peptidyl-prolyl cis-trans isomerase A (cyclophilin A)